MTDEERRRVLLDWNDTAEPQPSHTVPELFADAVRLDRTPRRSWPETCG